MKNDNKNFKTEVATKSTPSNEVKTPSGAGAISNEQKDEQAGATQGEPNKDTNATALMVLPKPLSVEEKLRHIENLHRISVQRENLLERIATLNDFEIDLMEESDELESNHFTGCRLILMANNGKQFTTNTAGLISKVVDFVKETCATRKTELEASLQFPIV